VLTCAVGFQIARILYYRHNYISFQFGFLLLCFFWGVVRSFFWGFLPVIDDGWVASILQWLPVNLQFATFSLLVLFFVHLVQKSNGAKDLQKQYVIAYAVVNVVLLTLQGVWLGFEIYYITDTTEDLPDWIPQSQAGFSGVVFLILVIILARYGWQVHNAIKTSKILIQMQIPPTIFVVSVFIFILFSSRCVFDFMNAAGHWNVFLASDSLKDELIIFFAYFFWEILPTLLIVGLFWTIPTTKIGGLTRRGRGSMFYFPPSPHAKAYSKDPHNAAGLASRLFSDPQRYDSDDETTGFLNRGSPSSYTHSSPSPYTAYSYGKNTPYSTTPTPINPSEGDPMK